MLYQGIASRTFNLTFILADHVKVAAADLERGLLAMELVREVPEQLKPRRIQIAGMAGRSEQDNEPDRVEAESQVA